MVVKKNSTPKEKPVVIEKKLVKDRISDGAFHSRAIIEIVGKPKEHVEESLNSFIVKISKDERYSLTSYDIEKANKVEKSENLYSVFAEIEFLSKTIEEIMNFVIDYMPASIEVLEPSSLYTSANFFSNMLTELVGRLHSIDMEFKKVKAQNGLLSQSLGIMIQNSILILLNLGSKSIKDISKIVGVDEAQVKIFLDKLEKDGKVTQKEGIYSLFKK